MSKLIADIKLKKSKHYLMVLSLINDKIIKKCILVNIMYLIIIIHIIQKITLNKS